MSKYTYKDIIIDPNDPRLEGAIGKECYLADTPQICLNRANNDEEPQVLGEILNQVPIHMFPFVKFPIGSVGHRYVILRKLAMSDKYTKEDIISWQNLPENFEELIGKEVFFGDYPTSLIRNANFGKNDAKGILTSFNSDYLMFDIDFDLYYNFPRLYIIPVKEEEA